MPFTTTRRDAGLLEITTARIKPTWTLIQLDISARPACSLCDVAMMTLINVRLDFPSRGSVKPLQENGEIDNWLGFIVHYDASLPTAPYTFLDIDFSEGEVYGITSEADFLRPQPTLRKITATDLNCGGQTSLYAVGALVDGAAVDAGCSSDASADFPSSPDSPDPSTVEGCSVESSTVGRLNEGAGVRAGSEPSLDDPPVSPEELEGLPADPSSELSDGKSPLVVGEPMNKNIEAAVDGETDGETVGETVGERGGVIWRNIEGDIEGTFEGVIDGAIEEDFDGTFEGGEFLRTLWSLVGGKPSSSLKESLASKTPQARMDSSPQQSSATKLSTMMRQDSHHLSFEHAAGRPASRLEHRYQPRTRDQHPNGQRGCARLPAPSHERYSPSLFYQLDPRRTDGSAGCTNPPPRHSSQSALRGKWTACGIPFAAYLGGSESSACIQRIHA